MIPPLVRMESPGRGRFRQRSKDGRIDAPAPNFAPKDFPALAKRYYDFRRQ
jgi:hypothetical protein